MAGTLAMPRTDSPQTNLPVEAPRSVALLRALQLGDLLCAVPALRALRAAWPRATITLIGLPWAEGFARRFASYVDEFVAFPGYPGLPEQPPQVDKLPAFFARMRARGFDLSVQMHGSGMVTNEVIELLGARQSAGFRPANGHASDREHFLPYPETLHEVRRILALLLHLGLPVPDEALEFPLTDADFREADALPGVARLVPGRYVCLHPGARHAHKRWAPERFAAVGDALHDAGFDVVLTGSAAEQPITRAVAQAMRAPALDCASDVSIGALAAVLARARLLVCNDTGVSHVACGLGLPSVVVFFATDPSRWAPLDATRHRAIYDPAGVSAAAVLSAIADLLA
jgi:ADP-heptose:LPS heptosyltransferase